MSYKSGKLINIVQDTKTNLEEITKVLPSGIVLHETDTKKIKISDGTNTYVNLPYSGGEELGDHSSTEPKFGVGTEEEYGHVKMASTEAPEPATSTIDTTSNDISVCKILPMSTDTYLYIGLNHDGEFVSAVIDKSLSLNMGQWNNTNISLNNITWLPLYKGFKINNYYIFTSELELAYSTDGINWTVVDYTSNVTDQSVPEGSNVDYNHILKVAYCQENNTYWIGTKTGVITVDSNFSFIDYVSNVESSNATFDIRDYVVIGDKFVAITTTFVSN